MPRGQSLKATASSASVASPLQTGLSSGCQSFISSFDTDSSFTACSRSLIEATQGFDPGQGASASSENVTSAIDGICAGSVSSACPDNLIRGKLADFYSACSDELTSAPNQQIRDLYDVLYVLTPFKQAICSKDDSGNYCVLAGSNSSSSDDSTSLPSQSSLNQIQKSLSYVPNNGTSLLSRGEDVVLANLTTFHNNNIVFLFRNENWGISGLCTTCTRNILTSHLNYQSESLYAPGLPNSQLLGGQDLLVGATEQKCGANFLNGAVQAAGGIKSGSFTSGAVKGVSDRFAGIMTVVAGGLTVAIAFL